MIFFLILTFSVLVVSSHGAKLHESMTPDEVELIFRTNHDNVPEYEVVPVAHTIHENSPPESPHHIVQLNSFKQDIKLYLEPTEGFLASVNTPMYIAESDPTLSMGIKYTKIPNALKDMSYFYQDPYNFAAITSSYDEDGEILFEGTIGDDLVIQPLPRRLRNRYSRNKRSVYDDFLSISNRTVYHPNLKHTHDHIVYKKKEIQLSGIRSRTEETDGSRSKRSAPLNNTPPKTIYPQILVILEYNEFLSLKTLDEVKRYVISFWNAVDLRYRVFLKPEIRLNIAGIVVATDPGGAPYIQNHRFNKYVNREANGPIVDADEALDHLGEYFFYETFNETKARRTFEFETDFDIAVTMTNLDLCNLEPNDNDFDCTTLGFAVRGGACAVSMIHRRINAVAIVEDNGGYTGIIPAAHEVGHLLGAPHDDLEHTVCPPSGGYMMTGMLTFTERVFKWSTCSMNYFLEFFGSVKALCLSDVPKITRPVKRVLPGQILSLDEQCDRIRGTTACNKDESACYRLDCLILDSGGQCMPVAPAAEGSPCMDGYFCLNGKCVEKTAKEVLLEFAPPPGAEREFDGRLGRSSRRRF